MYIVTFTLIRINLILMKLGISKDYKRQWTASIITLCRIGLNKQYSRKKKVVTSRIDVTTFLSLYLCSHVHLSTNLFTKTLVQLTHTYYLFVYIPHSLRLFLHYEIRKNYVRLIPFVHKLLLDPLVLQQTFSFE